MRSPDFTVAVVNKNGREVLDKTLTSIQAYDDKPAEVLLIDDGSTDGSPAWVREHHPDVRVIELEPPAGRPSVGRNRALREAQTPYVLLLDNDVRLLPDAPRRLIQTLTDRPAVLGTTPRLIFDRDPNRLYLDGSAMHYLAVSTASVRDLSVSDRPADGPFPSLNGGNIMLDRARALELGGFDEQYLFGWGEDAELALRAALRGWSVLHVPTAVGRHVAHPHGRSRAEAQFYNRYRVMFTLYSGRSLVLLAPVLVAFELALLGVGVLEGWTPSHARAMRRALREWRDLRRRRQEIQRQRCAGDEVLFAPGPLCSPRRRQASRSRWLLGQAADRVLVR